MKKAPGLLPPDSWLNQNGFQYVVRSKYQYPEAFAHIKQAKPDPLRKWLDLVQALRDKHGMIPSNRWLKAHGHSGLILIIHKHPEPFAHFKRDCKLRGQFLKIEDQVQRAEELAGRNGGFLPTKNWLEANSYNSIILARRRRPELFVHIPQANLDNKGTPAGVKWLPVAQLLADENGGYCRH